MAKGDSDIDIGINTRADTSGLEKTRTGLKGVIDDFRAAPGVMGKLTVGIAAVTAALAALKAAFSLARKAVDEFSEGEVRFKSFAQAAANTGKLTEGFTDQVGSLVDRMEDLTKIEGDKWWAALEEVTKRGAGPENIERMADGIANLAGLMGADGDITTAAKVLGQAMDGQTEMLRRYGIEVDKTASKSEMLESILVQLAERGAGILERRGKTLKGEFEGVKLAFANLAEQTGGLIARTGILQVSAAGLAGAFKFLKDLLPETKHSIEEISNVTPKLANKFKEAGDSAEASAEGFTDAASALDKLRKSYDDATTAAEEYRRQQDSLDDAATAAALAEVDFLEESKTITSADARKARAGIRRESEQRKAQRELTSISGQEKTLRDQIMASELEMYSADAAAKGKGGLRDAMMNKAAKLFWLNDPNELRDPKRLEELMKPGPGHWASELERYKEFSRPVGAWDAYENADLGITPGRRMAEDKARIEAMLQAKVAEENERIASFQRSAVEFKDLPRIIQEGDAAEVAAAEARERVTKIRGTNRRELEGLTNRRTEIGFAQRRTDVENAAELVRTASAQDGNAAAEIQRNGMYHQQVGSEFLRMVREQNAMLEQILNETPLLKRDIYYLQQQAKHARNR